MTKKGKVVVISGIKGTFTIKEYDLPEPEERTALMKIEMCGICGSDVHYWQGYKPTFTVPFPGMFGHEIVGTLVSLGKGFNKDTLGNPLKVGDRIVPAALVTCGHCFYCEIAKEPVKCLNGKAYGHLGDGAPYHTGGYGEYLYLCLKEGAVFKTNLSPEVAVLLEPISIGVNAVDRTGIKVGETVVVQGDGPIGLLTLACVKEAGAGKIIMVGGYDARLKIAKEFGADMTIDMEKIKSSQERIEIVRKNSVGGYGADVVFECAGFPNAVPEGIEYLRYGGKFCELGHFADTGTIPINPSTHICAKCITIIGSWSSPTDTFVRGLKILESGRYAFEKMISHKLPLEKLGEAYESLSTTRVIDGEKVIKAVIAP